MKQPISNSNAVGKSEQISSKKSNPEPSHLDNVAGLFKKPVRVIFAAFYFAAGHERVFLLTNTQKDGKRFSQFAGLSD